MTIPGVKIHNLPDKNSVEMNVLKSCPFCGNQDIEFNLMHPQYFGKPDETYWCYFEVLCPECGAMMQNGKGNEQTWSDVAKELEEAWNKRTLRCELIVNQED